MKPSPGDSRGWPWTGVGYAICVAGIAAAIGIIVFDMGRGDSKNRTKPLSENRTKPTPKSPSGLTAPNIQIQSTPARTASLPPWDEGVGFSGDSPKQGLEQMIAKYNWEVAALSLDVAAYRKSLTGIDEFRNIYQYKFAPFVLDKLPSAIHSLKEQFGEDGFGPQSLNAGYSIPAAQIMVRQYAVALFDNTPSVALDLIRSDKVKLDQAATSSVLERCQWAMAISARTPSSDSNEYRNPFPEGSVEALRFKRDAALGAMAMVDALDTLYFDLPPDLAERERHVRQRYKQLCKRIQQEVPGGEKLLTEYVDADQEMMKEFEESRKLLLTGKTKKQREEEQRKKDEEERQKLVDDIKRKLLGNGKE